MKLINLSGRIGGIAKVNSEDYELVSGYTWWADRKNTTTYAYTQIRRNSKVKTIRMHQLIAGFSHPDHINGDGLDNRRSNLRQASRCQQAWNTIGRPGRYKGVTFQNRLRKNPWQARIAHNGHQIHLGYFSTSSLAAMAYNSAAIRLFGEFACINHIR